MAQIKNASVAVKLQSQSVQEGKEVLSIHPIAAIFLAITMEN